MHNDHIRYAELWYSHSSTITSNDFWELLLALRFKHNSQSLTKHDLYWLKYEEEA